MISGAFVGEGPTYPIIIIFDVQSKSTPATNTHPTHISIVGNHKYVINSITITSEGKPDDTNDGVLISGRAKINVSVQDWNGTSVMNYEI